MKYSSLADLFEALTNWRIWYHYSIQDIKNKYSRSFIGPFWITISMTVTIFAMGPLYGVLFSQGDNAFTLYLATGLVFWGFISNTLLESCTAFIGNESFIKQTTLPKYIYIFRILSRNLIVLAHNISIPILIALFYEKLSFKIIYLFPIIALVCFFLFFASVVVAFFCSRYRDLIPLVGNILQLSMFLTPVFWIHPDPKRLTFLNYNIFSYLINLLRAPFNCGNISSNDINVIVVVTVTITFLAIVLYQMYSKRVVYWV